MTTFTFGFMSEISFFCLAAMAALANFQIAIVFIQNKALLRLALENN